MRTISGYFVIGSTDQRKISRYRRTVTPTDQLTASRTLPTRRQPENVRTGVFIPYPEGLAELPEDRAPAISPDSADRLCG